MPKYKIIRQILEEATISAKDKEDAWNKVFALQVPKKRYRTISEEWISLRSDKDGLDN